MEKLITPFKKNHFFGYYDKSPLNDAKNFLLSHEVTSVGKKPNNNDEARICVTNLKNGNIKYVDTTKAWNYQQGSQLQWLSEEEFIFNSYKGGYIAKVFDLKNFKLKKILKNPIYSISDNNKIYSSIDYSRIHKFREGYGYLQKEYKSNESLLKICDIEDSKTLIELNVEDFQSYPEMNLNKCWIDHILFAPNSYDFVFLFRSLINDTSLFSYLFYYDYGQKKIFNVLNSGMAGHGAWFDKNNFIIWGREKQFTKKINKIDNSLLTSLIKIVRYIGVPNFVRKNLYGDEYIKFNKITKKTNSLKFKIPYNIAGGHFSFLNEKNLMISDTYHNHKNESILFSYDLKNKLLKKFNKFKCVESIKNKSFRCDLHPRIISNNELIIDSTHQGFRGMYLINENF